jgi:acyl dehydratase
MRRGRFYEDFTPGAILEHWPGRTVGESDHRLFCLITLNTFHEGPTVHVAYLYSLLLGLSMNDVSVNAIYHRESQIREFESVHQGDTIYCKSEVLSAEAIADKPDRGLVTLETRGYTQHDVLFMSFQRRMAVRRAPRP